MKHNNKYLSLITSVLTVVLGNAVYALAIKLFLLPGGIITGGTTGIALTVTYFFDIPMSGFILAFNIFMLFVGLLLLGKQFAVTTILSSVLYPFFLEFYGQIFGNLVITKDPILCTLFSGLGIGLGLGIVIRSGASTGGMDIPPLVLNKYFRLPVSVGLYIFDSIILLSQLLYNPFEKILYGILLMIVYSTVIDKVMLLGSTKTEVKIVSDKSREIADAILQQVDRGCTLLYGEGGYLHKHTHVVLSVVSNRELPKIEKLVRSIDPESFIIVSHVTEVYGRGFSFGKHYAKQEPDLT